MTYCTVCAGDFEGEYWQTKCKDCWKEVRQQTTKAQDSQHYALVAERKWKPIPPGSKSEHARQQLAEALRLAREASC